MAYIYFAGMLIHFRFGKEKAPLVADVVAMDEDEDDDGAAE